MRILILSISIVIITNNLLFAQQNDLFQGVLNDYIVLQSRIDYQALSEDERLDEYLSSFKEVDLSESDTTGIKAALINAYNAGTLKVGADHYPAGKIDKIYDGKLFLGRIFKKSAWDIQKVTIGSKEMSLNEVKEKLIELDDPRVAFLLYQPYLEGPKIIEEPVTSVNVEEYLENRADEFWNKNLRNVYEFGIKTLRVSSIVEVHREFFPADRKDFTVYIVEKLDPDLMAGFESHYRIYGGRTDIKEAILTDIKANPESWKIEYKPYEWVMNGVN